MFRVCRYQKYWVDDVFSHSSSYPVRLLFRGQVAHGSGSCEGGRMVGEMEVREALPLGLACPHVAPPRPVLTVSLGNDSWGQLTLQGLPLSSGDDPLPKGQPPPCEQPSLSISTGANHIS